MDSKYDILDFDLRSRSKLLAETFRDFQEYTEYYADALKLFQNSKKPRQVSLAVVVPSEVEVVFESSKSPSLRFPRYNGKVEVVHPLPKPNTPQKRGQVRAERLIQYSAVPKMIESFYADEFAVKKKIFDGKNPKRKKKVKS